MKKTSAGLGEGALMAQKSSVTASMGSFSLVSLSVVSFAALVACFPKVTRRAGVGGDVQPTATNRGGTADTVRNPSVVTSPVGKNPAPPISTATKGTTTPTNAGFIPTEAKPFMGKAYGAFEFSKAELVPQAGLKYRRPYVRIFKITGEEKYFVYPDVRKLNEFLTICNDSDLPYDPMYASFSTNLCKNDPGQHTFDKQLMIDLAKRLNDKITFEGYSFTPPGAGAKVQGRVKPEPGPLALDLGAICEERKAPPHALASFCSEYLAKRDAITAENGQGAFALFKDKAEASLVAQALSELYGIP